MDAAEAKRRWERKHLTKDEPHIQFRVICMNKRHQITLTKRGRLVLEGHRTKADEESTLVQMALGGDVCKCFECKKIFTKNVVTSGKYRIQHFSEIRETWANNRKLAGARRVRRRASAEPVPDAARTHQSSKLSYEIRVSFNHTTHKPAGTFTFDSDNKVPWWQGRMETRTYRLASIARHVAKKIYKKMLRPLVVGDGIRRCNQCNLSLIMVDTRRGGKHEIGVTVNNMWTWMPAPFAHATHDDVILTDKWVNNVALRFGRVMFNDNAVPLQIVDNLGIDRYKVICAVVDKAASAGYYTRLKEEVAYIHRRPFGGWVYTPTDDKVPTYAERIEAAKQFN